MLPFDSTHGPVFLTRKTGVQALLPPHAETRERCYPWMPKLVTERSISRLLCLFPSKYPFSLFPSPSSSSLPLASPLSSFTQFGRESGTSRRRRLMLYTGANYPLLYGRMGRGRKSGAKRGGEGRKEARLVGGGRFLRTEKGK